MLKGQQISYCLNIWHLGRGPQVISVFCGGILLIIRSKYGLSTGMVMERLFPCKASNCLHPSNYSTNGFHLSYITQHMQMELNYFLDLYFIWTNKARIWTHVAAREPRMVCIRDFEKEIQDFGCGPSTQIPYSNSHWMQWLWLTKAKAIKSTLSQSCSWHIILLVVIYF